MLKHKMLLIWELLNNKSVLQKCIEQILSALLEERRGDVGDQEWGTVSHWLHPQGSSQLVQGGDIHMHTQHTHMHTQHTHRATTTTCPSGEAEQRCEQPHEWE